jgi:LPXTG-motif cell wall-anchored protein
MRWKKMKKKMKRSAILVTGSMLAFLSLSSPMMARDENFSVKNNAVFSLSENANITDVSNAVVSGKGKISFTVPEGKQPMDLEFTCYKLNGKNKVIHAKVKGQYKAGKHTVDLELPADYDKDDLEITCQRNGSAEVVTWGRVAGGNWKAALKASVKLPNEALSDSSVITEVSNSVVSGVAKITFTVTKAPVDLEFISYKLNEDGKIVHAKVKGQYSVGKHTIDLALPANTDKYDLSITCTNSDKLSSFVWNRNAEGLWSKANIENNGQAEVTIPKLIISSTLVDKAANILMWKVKNPSAQDIIFFWNLEGTGQTGVKTIGAGEEMILTAKSDTPQKLITSVPGVQGYDVIILASEFVPVPVSPTPSPSTSGAVVGGTTGTSTPVPTPVPTPTPSTGTTTGTVAVGGTSTSNPTPTATPSTLPSPSPVSGGTTDQPVGSDSTTVVVSDASQNSPSGISQLPQTGEQAPYGAYAAGGLLVLLGALFLRRKTRS